jgi:uncharacterized protein YukE
VSGGFGTQPGELDAAAARFDEAARTVADAVAALRSTLAGLGAYVGTDEQGRAFAAQYDPKAADGFAAMAGEADAVRSLGQALRSSAREYQANDRGAAAPFRPPDR